MLFKTSAKLREYANAADINFISVQNLIAEVEERQLKPLIGPQYAVLNGAYTAAAQESDLTGLELILLDRCRKVVGPYVCYYYAVLADGSLSDSGFKRSETDNFKTAYQYQLKNFRTANLQQAEYAAENLLGYMEDNATDYPLWKASDEYKQYKEIFIQTAKEFQSLQHTETPHSIYRQCRTKMVDIEENEIRKMLGTELYNLLKVKNNNGTLDTEEKQLVGKLKKAIAKLALGFSLEAINIQIGSSGLSVISQAARSKDDDIGERSNADAKAISALQRSLIESGRDWLQNASSYLREYPLIFTTYPGNIVNNTAVGADPGGSYGLV